MKRTLRVGLTVFVAATLTMGCRGSDRAPYAFRNPGTQCPLPAVPSGSTADTDGDGTPDNLDPDADGDGLPNLGEHVGGPECLGPDPDMDGVLSWLDTDSDDDGLPDRDELDRGTDPYAVDSDEDGASDFVEVRGAHSDPLDAASAPDPNDVILEVSQGSKLEPIKLRAKNRIQAADVFLLVDVTKTMKVEREQLVREINQTLVPGLEQAIPDLWIGVGMVGDYAVPPYGTPTDQPFAVLSQVIPPQQDEYSWSEDGTAIDCAPAGGIFEPGSNGLIDLADALSGLPCLDGGDNPDAYVPALWSIATGKGLWRPDGDPQDAECPDGGFGYPCFRELALPVIVVIGDDAFHDGPGGAEAYDRKLVASAPTLTQTIAALRAIDARVIGLFSGQNDMFGGTKAGKRAHFEELALRTGSVDAAGEPLVFDVAPDARRQAELLIEGIRTLAEGFTWDVEARALSVLDVGPFDPVRLVRDLRAERGFAPDGSPGANPGKSYRSKEGALFKEVAPSAEVEYQLLLDPGKLPARGEHAQLHTLHVGIIGDGSVVVAIRRVHLVMPPKHGALRLMESEAER